MKRTLSIFVFATVGFLLMEGGARIYNRFFTLTNRSVKNEFVITPIHGDPAATLLNARLRMRLGYSPPLADQRTTEMMFLKGKVLREATYTVDSLGHRICQSCRAPRNATTFLAILGCSFAFGQMVNDDETLSAHLQPLLPNVHVYNRGVIGHGPHQTLPLIREFDSGIKEKAGHAVYVWMDDHLDRLIGSSRYFTWHSPGGCPFWDWDVNDVLKENGTFGQRIKGFHRELYSYLWSQLVSHSAFLAHLKLELPLHMVANDANWKKASQMLKLISDASRENLHATEFSVLLWPGSRRGQKHLVPKLRQLGIAVLDYTTLFDPHAYTIPLNGHPSALAHHTVALKMARDIESNGKTPLQLN